MKIAFLILGEGFCSYYRMNYPAEAIKNNGLAEVRVVVQGTDEVYDTCEWADVIVFQGVCSIYVRKVIKYIDESKLKKIVVIDFDDNMFDIDMSNQVYKFYGIKEHKGIWEDGVNGFDIKRNEESLKELAKTISIAHLITVSTKPLKDVMKKFNNNVVVLPNFINPKFMPERNWKSEDKLTIGYQGGDSHYIDIARIVPVIKRINEKYKGKIKFRFYGAAFKMLYEGLDHEVIPWVKPHLFYERFSKKLFDIGLIPLKSTKFTRCKSNIKFLEYAYYDIPVLAENVTPYKESIVNGNTGILYSDNDDMYKKLCILIEDSLIRKRISSNAKKYVIDKYDINKRVNLWIDAYKAYL